MLEEASEFLAGAYVKFGNYPQNNSNEPEPIEWLVLENNSRTALLLSKYGLDCKHYHEVEADIRWRGCDLRKWLNGEFLNRAFNANEQKRIAKSVINTGDNSRLRTKGCGNTRDKVFLLSLEEAEEYFPDEKSRICPPTVYAESRGDGTHKWAEGGSIYWLRSPGDKGVKAVAVYGDGFFRRRGYYGCTGNSRWPMGNGAFGVRPALRIKL